MPPRPKPPKPNPELKTGPADEDKPMPAMPPPVPEPGGGVPILERPFFCRTYRLCPPAPPATVHLRSGRLPTPLVAASAALLAVSATLLLALLVRYLVRRWRRRRGEQQQEEEALRDDDDDDEESVQGVDSAARGAGEAEGVDSGGVHHVWYIRTKGLDERAIAAIAAVVYDARKRRADDGGGCAVCLAEFRDGETLRLLPRCAHAFHRGCIDPWLRAHVNCPLCRAPVQAAEEAASAGTEEPQRRVPDRAVRRAASSMVAIPTRAWPDLPPQAPASSSGREEDTPGLAKISRLPKLSEALDLPGVAAGRSASFDAGSCRRFPTRSGPSTAAGVTGDETEPSR